MKMTSTRKPCLSKKALGLLAVASLCNLSHGRNLLPTELARASKRELQESVISAETELSDLPLAATDNQGEPTEPAFDLPSADGLPGQSDTDPSELDEAGKADDGSNVDPAVDQAEAADSGIEGESPGQEETGDGDSGPTTGTESATETPGSEQQETGEQTNPADPVSEQDQNDGTDETENNGTSTGGTGEGEQQNEDGTENEGIVDDIEKESEQGDEDPEKTDTDAVDSTIDPTEEPLDEEGEELAQEESSGEGDSGSKLQDQNKSDEQQQSFSSERLSPDKKDKNEMSVLAWIIGSAGLVALLVLSSILARCIDPTEAQKVHQEPEDVELDVEKFSVKQNHRVMLVDEEIREDSIGRLTDPAIQQDDAVDMNSNRFTREQEPLNSVGDRPFSVTGELINTDLKKQTSQSRILSAQTRQPNPSSFMAPTTQGANSSIQHGDQDENKSREGSLLPNIFAKRSFVNGENGTMTMIEDLPDMQDVQDMTDDAPPQFQENPRVVEVNEDSH